MSQPGAGSDEPRPGVQSPDDASAVRFAEGAWRQLADGIYIAVLEPEAVTIGLVTGATGALLVDTGSSPAQGRAVRRSLTAVTEVPLVAVAVTHWHYDHAFGLAAFADLPSIGHETLADRLRSDEARREAARLGVDVAELTVPARGIAVATAIDLGGRRVEIAHLGAGHTDGDLVVVVPDAGVVFAGDLVESADDPSIGADSVPDQWPQTLDGVIGLMTATTVLVPGHGDPVRRDEVFRQRGELAARVAARNGGPPSPEPGRPTLPLV